MAGEGAGAIEFCRADQVVVVGIGADGNGQTHRSVGRRGGVELGIVSRNRVGGGVACGIHIVSRHGLRLAIGRLGKGDVKAVGNVARRQHVRDGG